MNLDKIKDRVRPDEKAIWKKVNKFIEKLEKSIQKRKIEAVVEIGGSLAKGTLIKGDYDVDVFVKFSKRYKTDELSNYLEKILKPFKAERVHGSRDYFQLKKDNIQYELVPVYNIISVKEAVNITDASPLHAAWVRVVTEKKPEIKEEIRIAKLFCKAQRVYGAESYIKGFSGHVLDIITIYYGSFENLMKHASRWKKKQVIDFYDIHKGDVLKKLNRSKIVSPLIVIDPIDPDRNAAAALSEDIFMKFIEAAKKYLKSPSEKMFEKEKFSLEKLKKQNILIIAVTPLKGKKDIVGSKILKAFEAVYKHLLIGGFEVESYGWEWDSKAYLWIKLKKMKIEKEFVHEGPPMNVKKNFEEFKEKYPKSFVKNDRVYVRLERKFTEAGKLVKFLLKKEFIQKNFKSAKVL